MENNQDGNFLNIQDQTLQPSNTEERSQNVDSIVDQTRQTTFPTWNLSAAAPTLAPTAPQGSATASNAQLSAAASTFVPTVGKCYLPNDPASSGGTSLQPPWGYNGQQVMIGYSMPGANSRRDRRPVSNEQTAAYHGVVWKGKGREHTFQREHEPTPEYHRVNWNGAGPTENPQHGYEEALDYYGLPSADQGPRDTSQYWYEPTPEYYGANPNGEGPSNNPQPGYEQRPEYYGRDWNDDRPREIAQNEFLPLLPRSSVPKEPSSTISSADRNDTRAEEVPLPPSADEDWFLPLTFDYEIKTISGTPRSADRILRDLGFSRASEPSHQLEECDKEAFHKQPDVHSLTRVLKMAKQDRDNNVKAFEEREKFLRDQVGALGRIIEDLRSKADKDTKLSAELEESKMQLSAAQDRIKQLEETNLAEVLERQQKLMADNVHLRRRRDWYQKRNHQLQFVEITDLKSTVRKLEAVIKDGSSYHENLKIEHDRRTNSLEWSLATVIEERDKLRQRLDNVVDQRDSALKELAGFKERRRIRAYVYNPVKLDEANYTMIKVLRGQVKNLEHHEKDAASARAEIKELQRNNDKLRVDCEIFLDQISKFQRDPANARRAMHNLDKAQRALEENEKKQSEGTTKSAAEKDKMEKEILELQKQLDEKNWDAEKAKLEAGKAEAQEVEDAIIQENARSTEVGQGAQDLTSFDQLFSQKQSRKRAFSDFRFAQASSRKGKERLEPTGRDENM